MPRKKLVPLVVSILLFVTLAVGVSALVFDKMDSDEIKGTVSLKTGLTVPIQSEVDDRETEKPEAAVDNRIPVDTASAASQTANGVPVELEAGSGSGNTASTGQPAVDAASSASIKATGDSVSLYAGSGSGNTTPTGQPAVDAASSASIISPTSGIPPAADSGTGVSAATLPAVDAVASASLPKPGTPTSTTADARLITEADARNIAVAAIGNTAYVKEVEFELDDYPPVYDVKLLYGGKEYKIEIHAVTGAILDVERDEDD